MEPIIERRILWVHDDGGRELAGFKGDAGDCVTRSIAIATGLPYQTVYDELFERTLAHRPTMAKLELEYGQHARRHASPRYAGRRKIYESYLADLGWVWTPTMQIGSGCQVHLRKDELPSGRLLARVSKHLTAVIDGVVHDTHDPSRGGSRCVYGYYARASRPLAVTS